ncbi:MAG: ABC transporter ATP-binding protein [Gaiella sp.]
MNAVNTVVTRGLVVEYPSDRGPVRALVHAGLVVEGGSSLAVMGPSGCGKSTLLGLLAGLAVPTSGTVTIGDTPLSELPERRRLEFRRRALGMIYQADNLLPHLTVEENVGLQLAIVRGSNGGGRPADDPHRLLARLGLDGLAARFPDQLSGGQRQRVAVARAIVHRPSVILADEPTGSLDDENARAVIELISEVQREIGATLILVTHDPAIAAYADRVERLATPSHGAGPIHAG